MSKWAPSAPLSKRSAIASMAADSSPSSSWRNPLISSRSVSLGSPLAQFYEGQHWGIQATLELRIRPCCYFGVNYLYRKDSSTILAQHLFWRIHSKSSHLLPVYFHSRHRGKNFPSEVGWLPKCDPFFIPQNWSRITYELRNNRSSSQERGRLCLTLRQLVCNKNLSYMYTEFSC